MTVIDPADQQAPLPGRQEIASVTDLMLALVRSSKAVRTYLPNSPVLVAALKELRDGFARHIAQFGDVALEVEPFALHYKSFPVYQNRDPVDSLALRLHADGIRFLRFSAGVEQHELSELLEMVIAESSDAPDGSIVTKLWERRLPHISYLLVEDLAEQDADADLAAPSQQEAISRVRAAVQNGAAEAPQVIGKHLLMLTREEAAALRQARHDEWLRNPLDDLVTIINTVVTAARDEKLFSEYAALSVRSASQLILAGDIERALELLRELHGIARDASRPAEQRRQVEQALSTVLCEKTVDYLQDMLDTGGAITPLQLAELLRILGRNSIQWTCELLARAAKIGVRRVIIDVLVELGKGDPRLFAPMLSDSRWYLVRNLVLVLSLSGSPLALEMIAVVMSHREVRVRKEVLGLLEGSSDPRAGTYLLKFLRDESMALRIRALQIISRRKPAAALNALLALTASDSFKTKSLAEKRAVYQAVGALGSSREFEMLRQMLMKRFWLKKGQEKENVVLAAAGLVAMGTPAALQLLEKGARQRKPEVARVIREAMEAITAAPQEGEQLARREAYGARDKKRSAAGGGSPAGEGPGKQAVRAV